MTKEGAMAPPDLEKMTLRLWSRVTALEYMVEVLLGSALVHAADMKSRLAEIGDDNALEMRTDLGDEGLTEDLLRCQRKAVEQLIEGGDGQAQFLRDRHRNLG